jgi:hypothetical protein
MQTQSGTNVSTCMVDATVMGTLLMRDVNDCGRQQRATSCWLEVLAVTESAQHLRQDLATVHSTVSFV